jgi:hypothetical protein
MDTYIQTLIKDPAIAMISEHPTIKTRCEDLSKPILALFILMKQGKVNADQMKAILERVFIEYFGRFLPADCKMESFFTIENKDVFSEKISLKQVVAGLEEKYSAESHLKFPHLSDYQTALRTAIHNVKFAKDLCETFKIGVKTKFFEKDRDSKISLPALENVYRYFMKSEVDRSKLYPLGVVHAFRYKNSHERNTTKIDDHLESALRPLQSLLIRSLIKKHKAKTFEALWKVEEQKYIKAFSEIHAHIDLVQDSDLRAHCEFTKTKYDDYRYNPETMLCGRACLARKCPFYLRVDPRYQEHVASDIHSIPGFNKTIRALLDRPAEEIWAAVLEGRVLRQDRHLPQITPAMQAMKAEALALIEERRKEYQKTL